MKNKNKVFSGFTLIELLVVIAIMSLLASVVLVTSQRGLGSSRDARRVQELYQVAQSLQMYYTAHEHQFPDVADIDDPGCNIHGVVWDAGNVALGVADTFVKPVYDEKFMGDIQVKEWTKLKDYAGSACTFRFAKVVNPCDGRCVGTYAILYAACEENGCPKGERPACCNGSTWLEGAGANDSYDIAIFLKQ